MLTLPKRTGDPSPKKKLGFPKVSSFPSDMHIKLESNLLWVALQVINFKETSLKKFNVSGTEGNPLK